MRTHVNTYENSIRYHNEMIQMAAFKDSIANSLFKEVNEIKKKSKKWLMNIRGHTFFVHG